MKDEYLLISQAAYLVSKTKQNFEKLIDAGKLPCEVCKGVRLVRVSDLTRYVMKQLERFHNARVYFMADNKSTFWNLQHLNFHNSGCWHDDSMIEYLTISQVAYLLGMSRQAIHGLVNRRKIKGQFVELPRHKRPIVFIRADELKRYLDKHDSKYARAIEFFDSEDSFAFWESHSNDFEENWMQPYKERNQKYYERKKERKIQEKNRRTGEGGGAGPSSSGTVEGQI